MRLHSSEKPSRAGMGQTMAEYGMIGWLIAAFAVGGLVVLSGSLSGILEALLGDMGGGSSAAGSSGKFPASKGAGTMNIQPASASGAQGSVTVTLENGTEVNMDNYLIDTKKAIETLGANGTTDLLASNITSLANKLLAEGEITQLQASRLHDLANKIHDMAAMERIVEQAMAKSPDDINPLLNKPYTYNGVTYSDMGALIAEFGLTPYNTVKYGLPPVVPNDGMNSANGRTLQAVLDAYESAKASGALADEMVQKFVGSSVTEVYWTADSLESVVAWSSKDPNLPPRDVNAWTVAGYDQRNASPVITETSTLNHYNAGQICAAGGGGSGGVYCAAPPAETPPVETAPEAAAEPPPPTP